jgi:hypothetical protein
MSKIQGPFWRYYGGKWRAAPRYPKPAHQTIIEPFAGAAGYSLRHHAADVLLLDKSEAVCGVWDYLIRAPVSEILALPDIRRGQSVDDLPICQEARWLMGLWCNPGSAAPSKSPSVWASVQTTHHKNWNTLGRQRCAQQAPLIRHWRIQQGTYRDAPDVAATWFVDPPYQGKAGSHYPHGSKAIDYTDLAEWCRLRDGRVIVCEGPDANWLPFVHFADILATPGKTRTGKSAEQIWLKL